MKGQKPTVNMTEQGSVKEIFLLLENLTKSNNLGPTLRCATAFGIRVVVAIGFAKCSTEGKNSD
jgi:tRNA G18 (ribose-2'-O)-methylase SpoU